MVPYVVRIGSVMEAQLTLDISRLDISVPVFPLKMDLKGSGQARFIITLAAFQVFFFRVNVFHVGAHSILVEKHLWT